MKKIMIVVLMLVACQAFAQNVKNSLAISLEGKDSSVTLSTYDASLEIEGYDGNEIVIERLKMEDATAPANLDGLPRITDKVKVPDDGGINYRITRDTSSQVELTLRSAGYFKVRIPNKLLLLDLKGYSTVTGTKIHISNLACKFKVYSSVTDLIVDNVSKGFSLDGNSKLKLSNINWDTNDKSVWAYRIVTNNNEIDISVPEKLAADLYVVTSGGKAYSDLDLQPTDSILKMNGGGLKILVSAHNSNAYLRKQK